MEQWSGGYERVYASILTVYEEGRDWTHSMDKAMSGWSVYDSDLLVLVVVFSRPKTKYCNRKIENRESSIGFLPISNSGQCPEQVQGCRASCRVPVLISETQC